MTRKELKSLIKEIYIHLSEKDDNWWTKLSPEEQSKYLKDHPNSAKAKEIKAKQQKAKQQSSSSEVLKLKQAMPKMDIGTKSSLNKIPNKIKGKVSMLIDKLAEAAKTAKEKGEKAPDFDLCSITVSGTNLYCERNLGIPRAEMPQFKGFARPGSPADKLPKDPKSGEVDTEAMFKSLLKKKKINVSNVIEFPSDQLKATQTQLVGAKVAGMTKALEANPEHPAITAPIYVSRDGYVLDGHHRWAAQTSLAIKNNKPVNMKTIVVDMDGKDLVELANNFSNKIGIQQKKATSTAK